MRIDTKLYSIMEPRAGFEPATCRSPDPVYEAAALRSCLGIYQAEPPRHSASNASQSCLKVYSLLNRFFPRIHNSQRINSMFQTPHNLQPKPMFTFHQVSELQSYTMTEFHASTQILNKLKDLI